MSSKVAKPFVRNNPVPTGCVVVGWQHRYGRGDPWRFTTKHPGTLPEGYIDRTVRPVYARAEDEVLQKPKHPEGY